MGCPRGMTYKQQRFCKHYSIHQDVKRAALEADVLLDTAKQWLLDPKIDETWKRYRGDWLYKSGVTPEEIMAGIVGIAFNETNTPKDRMTAYSRLADIMGMTGHKNTDAQIVVNLGQSEAEEDDSDDVEEIDNEYNDDKRD